MGSLGFVTGVAVCNIWEGFVTGFVIIFMLHTWINLFFLNAEAVVEGGHDADDKGCDGGDD